MKFKGTSLESNPYFYRLYNARLDTFSMAFCSNIYSGSTKSAASQICAGIRNGQQNSCSGITIYYLLNTLLELK